MDQGIPQSEREWSEFFTSWHERGVQLLCRDCSLREDCAEDIVQDAFVALYLNIKQGKLTNLTCKLSTYFIQICLFQARKRIRDEREKLVLTEDMQYSTDKLDELMNIGESVTPAQQECMEQLVSRLPEPCNKILWLFYYESRTMTEIAEAVNFKNADTAKAKKSQCISRLRTTYGLIIKETMYER